MNAIYTSLTICALFMAFATVAKAESGSCPVVASKSISILNTRAAGSPGGPEISVSADGQLSVKLVASESTEIDLESVRVRYSIFDITRKIEEHVGDITPDMNVSGDILPVGTHKLSIRVSDTAGRSTKLRLTLDVASLGNSHTCTDVVTASADASDLATRG